MGCGGGGCVPGGKGTTTQRGLGWQHQRQRAALLRCHVDGTLCWWCGKPMYRSQELAADHSTARTHGSHRLADRLLHRKCNEQRGDGRRDNERPALFLADSAQEIFVTREW